MMAAWHQIPRIRAERQLEAVQVASVQDMRAHDRRSFVDRLIDQARGVVEEVVSAAGESVVWNGKVLGTARAIKGQVVQAFGRKAVA